jgi:hypothetical protein
MIGPTPQSSRRRSALAPQRLGYDLSIFIGEPKGSDCRKPVPEPVSLLQPLSIARAYIMTRHEYPPVWMGALCDASGRRWLAPNNTRKFERFRRVGGVGQC